MRRSIHHRKPRRQSVKGLLERESLLIGTPVVEQRDARDAAPLGRQPQRRVACDMQRGTCHERARIVLGEQLLGLVDARRCPHRHGNAALPLKRSVAGAIGKDDHSPAALRRCPGDSGERRRRTGVAREDSKPPGSPRRPS